MRQMLWAVVALWVSFGLGYIIGQARTKVTIAQKQTEVIKNVAKKRAVIQAEPNASRTELLELMRAGKL